MKNLVGCCCCLFGCNVAFSDLNVTTVSGYDRELNIYFYSVASLLNSLLRPFDQPYNNVLFDDICGSGNRIKMDKMDRVKRIWYLSPMRAVSQEESSDRKPDPWPL